MKGYIKGRTVILLEELPNYLQEGDEVEILIPAVEPTEKKLLNLQIIEVNNKDKIDKDGSHLGAISSSESEDFDESLPMEAELHDFKLAALKQDINLGISQLANGEYTEYDTETLPQLRENLKSRGQNRLIQHKNESI